MVVSLLVKVAIGLMLMAKLIGLITVSERHGLLYGWVILLGN